MVGQPLILGKEKFCRGQLSPGALRRGYTVARRAGHRSISCAIAARRTSARRRRPSGSAGPARDGLYAIIHGIFEVGSLPHELTMKSTELFAPEVMPALHAEFA